MNISVTELSPGSSPRYPYTHRAVIRENALAFDRVSDWLIENKIPHCQLPIGVFYLRKDDLAFLMLKWS